MNEVPVPIGLLLFGGFFLGVLIGFVLGGITAASSMQQKDGGRDG
jgi:hypothetical protein